MKRYVILLIIGIFSLYSLSYNVIGCTGFTATEGNTVLVGNNEDINLAAEPQLRIYPPSETSYGRVLFYCKWPYPFNEGRYTSFGGMNDQGLFYDVYSTPLFAQINSSNLPIYNGDLFASCLRTCTTVEEVINEYRRYHISWMDNVQVFVVDKTGNSAIIEGDDIIYKGGSYQVVTNFLQSHPEIGWYPCWRYDTAVSMFENMATPSVEYFRDICNAVHMNNIPSSDMGYTLDTVYSNICDLEEGIMYLYFYHDYTHHIEINFETIFEDGYRIYDLVSLFEDESNHAPNTPETPSGPSSGNSNVEYEYVTSGTDNDDDILFYLFDWGDGSDTGWIGPYASGEEYRAIHSWDEQGAYEIKVKVRDMFNAESEWSDPLPVSMPKTYERPLWDLFEKFIRWLEQVFEGELFSIFN